MQTLVSSTLFSHSVTSFHWFALSTILLSINLYLAKCSCPSVIDPQCHLVRWWCMSKLDFLWQWGEADGGLNFFAVSLSWQAISPIEFVPKHWSIRLLAMCYVGIVRDICLKIPSSGRLTPQAALSMEMPPTPHKVPPKASNLNLFPMLWHSWLPRTYPQGSSPDGTS